jgi:hypothetical protein
MYTIQYQAVDGTHKMQEVACKARSTLAIWLARAEYPIMAVYEQTTPITKAMQKELQSWPGSLSRCAREFADHGPRA